MIIYALIFDQKKKKLWKFMSLKFFPVWSDSEKLLSSFCYGYFDQMMIWLKFDHVDDNNVRLTCSPLIQLIWIQCFARLVFFIFFSHEYKIIISRIDYSCRFFFCSLLLYIWWMWNFYFVCLFWTLCVATSGDMCSLCTLHTYIWCLWWDFYTCYIQRFCTILFDDDHHHWQFINGEKNGHFF